VKNILTVEDRMVVVLVVEVEDGDTMTMTMEMKIPIHPLEEFAPVVGEAVAEEDEGIMVIGGSRITGVVVEDILVMMMGGTINTAVTEVDVVQMMGTMTSMPGTDTIIKEIR